MRIEDPIPVPWSMIMMWIRRYIGRGFGWCQTGDTRTNPLQSIGIGADSGANSLMSSMMSTNVFYRHAKEQKSVREAV